jgi:hypothetical protein
MPAYLLAVHFFGKAYGWTERQTMEETSEAGYDWLPKIVEADARAQNLLRKQAERAARQTGRHAR